LFGWLDANSRKRSQTSRPINRAKKAFQPFCAWNLPILILIGEKSPLLSLGRSFDSFIPRFERRMFQIVTYRYVRISINQFIAEKGKQKQQSFSFSQ
jgi:hypothetical protein